MTLLQIGITHDRALIATDTATYTSDQGEYRGADVLYWPAGEPVAVQKVYPLPHLRAVLCGRGTNSVHRFAADALTYARDFDHAVELLARALPKLTGTRWRGTYKGKPLMHTVHLVGWSPRKDAMAHTEFGSESGYLPHVTHGQADGWAYSLGPAVKRPAWLNDPEQLAARQDEAAAYFEQDRKRDPRCIATAEAYARAAIEQQRAEDPSAPYGGRLLVAELTRDSLRMVDCGDVGLPVRRPGAADLMTYLQPSLLCINPGAVTGAWTDETGADSVSIGGGGGTAFETCATRTYVNDTGRAVVVQWDAEVTGLYFSSGATLAPPADFASATWVLKVNGTPTLTDSFIDTTNDAAVPGSTDRRTRLAGWQYTLAAGDTALLEISVGGGTDANAATISWARTRLRTTIIKA